MARGAAVAGPPRRMICICAPLGFYPGNFIPRETGKDYELTPYLEVLQGVPRRFHGHLRVVQRE